MRRRTFLISFVATAGLIKVLGVKHLKDSINVAETKLKAGDVVIAESGGRLCLPSSPEDGDMIQIIVENSTLHQPCIVKSETAAIVGDRETLELDTIANFRLTYNSKLNDWVIT